MNASDWHVKSTRFPRFLAVSHELHEGSNRLGQSCYSTKQVENHSGASVNQPKVNHLFIIRAGVGSAKIAVRTAQVTIQKSLRAGGVRHRNVKKVTSAALGEFLVRAWRDHHGSRNPKLVWIR